MLRKATHLLQQRFLPFFRSMPVRYKGFSAKDAEAFDDWVEKRTSHLAKGVILDWLATEPLLGENFSVLDIGCGPGVFAAMILQHAKLKNRIAYTGVDQSENVIQYCRQAYPVTFTFLRSDVLAEGLPHGSFDVIVINEVVEHLPNYTSLIDMAMAKKPNVFALAGFAIEPSYSRNRVRWNRRAECYMNYYSFQRVFQYLRELAQDRPMLMADLGTRSCPENEWFPKKTPTVFFLRLAAAKAGTSDETAGFCRAAQGECRVAQD